MSGMNEWKRRKSLLLEQHHENAVVGSDARVFKYFHSDRLLQSLYRWHQISFQSFQSLLFALFSKKTLSIFIEWFEVRDDEVEVEKWVKSLQFSLPLFVWMTFRVSLSRVAAVAQVKDSDDVSDSFVDKSNVNIPQQTAKNLSTSLRCWSFLHFFLAVFSLNWRWRWHVWVNNVRLCGVFCIFLFI